MHSYFLHAPRDTHTQPPHGSGDDPEGSGGSRCPQGFSAIRKGHKSDHMLLGHLSGCNKAEGASLIWRGTWSILGGGSRHPAPFRPRSSL